MRPTLLLLLAAALLLPVTADAKRGGRDRGVAGTVTAYDPDSGELTLETRRSGRELTALVVRDTEVECEDDSRPDDDDDEDQRGRGRGRDDDDECGETGLAVGATVTRARIDVDDGEPVWSKLRLDS